MSRQKIIKRVFDELQGEIEIKKINKVINTRKKVPSTEFITKKSKNNREVLNKNTFKESDTILLKYYQYLIKESFNVRAPNRNIIIKEMLNVCPYIEKYNNKVLCKFDLENFYSSISIEKVLKEIEENDRLLSSEKNFLISTFSRLKVLYPGLGIVNNLVEILGKKFDDKIHQIFDCNIVMYKRYVDDCIIIFDQPITEEEIITKVERLILEIFGNKAKLNEEKTVYLDFKDVNKSFDYLGYSFNYDSNGHNFKLGIAKNKIKKGKERLEKIINSYKKNENKELLLIRMDLFFKRLVYLNESKGKNWEVRGLSQNYSEATRLIRYSQDKNCFVKGDLDNKTFSFFKGKYIIGIFHDCNVDLPKELKNYLDNNRYISNLYNNKAIILHRNIGYTYEKLSRTLTEAGVNIDTSMNYKKLAYMYKKNIYNL